MTVKILFFSVLRDKVGRDDLEVSLGSAMSGKQLLDKLSMDFEAIQLYRNVIRIAVNESYVKEDYELKNGDEVALITPVSGG